MLPLTVETLLKAKRHGTGLFITEVEMDTSPERIAVNIPRDARVAADADDRWTLSNPDNRRWRWSAGGALMVMRLRDCTVAALSVSDPNLRVWASHLTATTGFAPSEEEWVRPIRLMREAFRSIAVATPTGLMVPSFGDPELDALAFGTVPSLLHLLEFESSLPPLYHMDLFNIVGAQLLPLKGEKEVVVSVGGVECSRTRALAVLDPETRGIDLMHAYEVDLGVCTLEEISVFHVKESDGRARNLEIGLLELGPGYKPVRLLRSYRSGHPVTGLADIEKMSPVLRETLGAL